MHKAYLKINFITADLQQKIGPINFNNNFKSLINFPLTLCQISKTYKCFKLPKHELQFYISQNFYPNVIYYLHTYMQYKSANFVYLVSNGLDLHQCCKGTAPKI